MPQIGRTSQRAHCEKWTIYRWTGHYRGPLDSRHVEITSISHTTATLGRCSLRQESRQPSKIHRQSITADHSYVSYLLFPVLAIFSHVFSVTSTRSPTFLDVQFFNEKSCTYCLIKIFKFIIKIWHVYIVRVI